MTEKLFAKLAVVGVIRLYTTHNKYKDYEGDEVLNLINSQHEEKEQLKQENKELKAENEELKEDLKRCRNWINSDKDDYELTLSFIKNKGYSLKDVLEYEKELKE